MINNIASSIKSDVRIIDNAKNVSNNVKITDTNFSLFILNVIIQEYNLNLST